MPDDLSFADGVNTPWRMRDCRVILAAMNNKARLIEVRFLAGAVAMATVAFTIMVGNALWMRVAGD